MTIEMENVGILCHESRNQDPVNESQFPVPSMVPIFIKNQALDSR